MRSTDEAHAFYCPFIQGKRNNLHASQALSAKKVPLARLRELHLISDPPPSTTPEAGSTALAIGRGKIEKREPHSDTLCSSESQQRTKAHFSSLWRDVVSIPAGT